MRKFLKGFVYAWRGLITCVKEERNFRFHLVVAFHLFVYLPFFVLTRAEVCEIIILCGLVIAAEAMNSATERAVDATGRHNAAAGAAKDIAAGAVLTLAITAAVCGVKLLWQPAAFRAIAAFYIRRPWAAILQGIAAAGGVEFIKGRRRGNR